MGYAVGLEVFIAGAGLDPNPNRSGTDVFHLFGDESQTIRQDLPAYVAYFLNHDVYRSDNEAVSDYRYCYTPGPGTANANVNPL